MDETELRLRCLEVCGGNFAAAQRAIAFAKGIGVPAISEETWRAKGESADYAAEAGPEQTDEAFLADLKSGDEKPT